MLLVFGSLVGFILLIVLALTCVYFNSRKERDGGRSTVHVAQGTVSEGSEESQGDGPKARSKEGESKKKKKKKEKEKEKKKANGSATKANQIAPATLVGLSSSTAKGNVSQVSTGPNMEESAKIPAAVETEEDQRIFKTCQANVETWKYLEIKATEVTTSFRLGKGAYSEVFKGYIRGTIDCAIKKYRNTASERHIDLAWREIRLTGESDGLSLSPLSFSHAYTLAFSLTRSLTHLVPSAILALCCRTHLQHPWTIPALCASWLGLGPRCRRSQSSVAATSRPFT